MSIHSETTISPHLESQQQIAIGDLFQDTLQSQSTRKKIQASGKIPQDIATSFSKQHLTFQQKHFRF